MTSLGEGVVGCGGGGGGGGWVAMTTGRGSGDFGGGCASGRRLLPRSVSFFSSAPGPKEGIMCISNPCFCYKMYEGEEPEHNTAGVD